MPPRDEKECGMLFINDATWGYMPLGAIRELYIAEMDEHFTPRRGPDDGMIHPGTGEEGEFTIRPPRMSRRRFTKLLMGYGYSRNFAWDIAECSWRNRIPYRVMYFKILMNFLTLCANL